MGAPAVGAAPDSLDRRCVQGRESAIGARDPSEETGRLLKGRPWRMARESWTREILPDGVGFHLSRVNVRIQGGLEKWLESSGLLSSF